jgi:hypothetical protein
VRGLTTLCTEYSGSVVCIGSKALFWGLCWFCTLPAVVVLLLLFEVVWADGQGVIVVLIVKVL